MSDWVDISDKEEWEKRPNNIELLFPDGRTGQFFCQSFQPGVFGLVMDSICLKKEEATHWRPIKK